MNSASRHWNYAHGTPPDGNSCSLNPLSNLRGACLVWHDGCADISNPRPCHGSADAGCGEPTEDFYENVYNARNQPIRLGKLAALGTAVAPGESIE
jgi:hypothetical protein